MMFRRTLGIGLAAMLSAGLIGYAAADSRPAAKDVTVANDLSAQAKKTTVKRTTTVKRSGGTAVKKNTTVKRNTTVRRTTTVNRNVNVRYNRGYRAWARRPYYGTAFIGAVALGTVIAVTAPHVIPVAPGPNACWYWSDPAEVNGYWDYCTPP
jgi:hypothetical protein